MRNVHTIPTHIPSAMKKGNYRVQRQSARKDKRSKTQIKSAKFLTIIKNL